MTFRAEKAAYLEGFLNDTGDAVIFPLPWTGYGAGLVFLTLMSWVTNSALLMLFITHRRLLTSFTIYLVSLSIANLLQTAVMSTIDVVDSNSLYWWMGSRTCDLYQYVVYVVGGGIVQSHVLITLNRVWAVSFPVSYRVRHTKRTALVICFVMWLLINIICVPGLVVESLYYRLPENRSDCSVNPGSHWKLTVMIILFDCPILVVILAYPFLCWTHRRRLKTTDKTLEKKRRLGLGRVSPVISQSRHAQSSEAFLALTVTTCSIVLCWTPMEIYVTSTIFAVDEIPLFYDIALFLYYLQPVLDPIFFVLALQDLRTTVALWVSQRRCATTVIRQDEPFPQR